MYFLFCFIPFFCSATYEPGRNRARSRELPHNQLCFLLRSLYNEPRLYIPEMAVLLYLEFGAAYSEDEISRCLVDSNFSRKKLTFHAIEQSTSLTNAFLHEMRSPRLGGCYTSDMLLFVDESHEDGIQRTHGYSQVGTPAVVVAHARIRSMRSPRSAICSFSIEGMQSVHVSDTDVDTEIFLAVLEHDILPHTNAFPDVRSVVIFDNCVVHLSLIHI